MLKSFTKNYNDESTEAGFQFVFMCDCCGDGYRSSFIESETYKKKKKFGLLSSAASIGGGLLSSSKGTKVANATSQSSSVMADRFAGMPPEWRKEHENAFEKASNEAKQHFYKCPGCNKYACATCKNEDEGLCVTCAPRQEVLVAKAKSGAMQRNISDKAKDATVWKGEIESKTTICPQCGKPAGAGKFCNNCGASMELNTCVKCGAKNAKTVRFCNNCGTPTSAQAAPAAAAQPGKCSGCGEQNDPGMKFCGGCGDKL